MINEISVANRNRNTILASKRRITYAKERNKKNNKCAARKGENEGVEKVVMHLAKHAQRHCTAQ